MTRTLTSPVIFVVGIAMAVIALATAPAKGVVSWTLGAVFGNAQASEMAPGVARATSAGSCPIAESGPEGMTLVKAASSANGDSAPGAATTTGTKAAAAMMVAGGCNAVIPAPEGVVAVAFAEDAAADDPGLFDAAGVGEAEAEREFVEPVWPDLAQSAEPAQSVAVKSEGDVASQPKIAPPPRRPSAPIAVPKEAREAWWPATVSGKLNLRHASQASFAEAIVLLFDGAFETPESANQYIQVKDSKGAAVRGRWVVATNRQMLLFNAAPGIYSVEVGSGLVDKGGRSISGASSGLVAVR